jgi:chaperonin GroES
MKVKPLYDRVLVERVKSEEKTSGGIIIPDTAKEKPLEGIVRAVGQGKRADSGELMKLQVGEGDRILFGKYSGTEIAVEGVDHLILREDEILAILEK